MIGREHNTEELEKFAKEKKLSLAFAPDPKREIYGKYAEKYIPRNFIVGRDGTIKLASVGNSETSFQEIVQTLGERAQGAGAGGSGECGALSEVSISFPVWSQEDLEVCPERLPLLAFVAGQLGEVFLVTDSRKVDLVLPALQSDRDQFLVSGPARLCDVLPGGQFGLEPIEGLLAELGPGGVIGRGVVSAWPACGQYCGASAPCLAVARELGVGCECLAEESGGARVERLVEVCRHRKCLAFVLGGSPEVGSQSCVKAGHASQHREDLNARAAFRPCPLNLPNDRPTRSGW